jgi:hypothetical protein
VVSDCCSQQSEEGFLADSRATKQGSTTLTHSVPGPALIRTSGPESEKVKPPSLARGLCSIFARLLQGLYILRGGLSIISRDAGNFLLVGRFLGVVPLREQIYDLIRTDTGAF